MDPLLLAYLGALIIGAAFIRIEKEESPKQEDKIFRCKL